MEVTPLIGYFTMRFADTFLSDRAALYNSRHLLSVKYSFFSVVALGYRRYLYILFRVAASFPVSCIFPQYPHNLSIDGALILLRKLFECFQQVNRKPDGKAFSVFHVYIIASLRIRIKYPSMRPCSVPLTP